MPTVNINSISGFLVRVPHQLLQFGLWLLSARHKCSKKQTNKQTNLCAEPREAGNTDDNLYKT